MEQSGAMQIISGGETRPLEAYVGGLGVSGEQLRATVLEELPESRSIHSFQAAEVDARAGAGGGGRG